MADARPDVVVLGGGVAGLTAARALTAAGRSVVLVEAKGRLGGRILTVRAPGCPWPLELGAEFAHGDPAVTRRLTREAGLTSYDARFEMASLGGGERLSHDGDMAGDVARLVDEVRARRPGDISVAAFLDELTAHDAGWQARREAVLLYVCGFHAADPGRMSVHALATEEDARGQGQGADQRIVEGYDRIVDHLAAGVDPASVWLRTVARRLDWEPGRARVAVTTDGRWERVIEARAAVVALPLGVLQAAEGEEGALQFSPPPGHARDAIARLASGPALHAVLHFTRPFWEDEARGGERPWRDLSFFRVPSAPIAVWW
ncbi:MAG: FAD-dependent oxidoreductase, partial [Myxococcales bacterium]